MIKIGPDGSKIIRRHQQEKQINKITQVVTQRVIKRQYIDPTTGQILEYDPNNELFANLPPETVFEEHTIVSDDNANHLPVITTTSTSKTTPSHLSSFGNMKLTDTIDNSSKYATQYVQNQQFQQQNNGNSTASFRIKSHPEDNQGYPEERNMDYDPDDINCYPDDDLPYEGLIQSNGTLDQSQQRRHGNRGSGSNGSTSSSSSPALFDSHSGIDMPLLSNTEHFHQMSSKMKHHKGQKIYESNIGSGGTYTTVLPSCNIPGQSPRQKQNSGGCSSSNVYHNVQQAKMSSRSGTNVDQALLHQQMSQSRDYVSSNYLTKQQILQQNSPSLNHSNEYGKLTF